MGKVRCAQRLCVIVRSELKPGEGRSEERKQQHDLMKNFQSTDSNGEGLHILEIPACVS